MFFRIFFFSYYNVIISNFEYISINRISCCTNNISIININITAIFISTCNTIFSSFNYWISFIHISIIFTNSNSHITININTCFKGTLSINRSSFNSSSIWTTCTMYINGIWISTCNCWINCFTLFRNSTYIYR